MDSLIERIEAATGPDRELDRDIMLAAVPCDRAPFRYWVPMNENTGHGAVDVDRVYYGPHCAQAVAVPPFTASLDAVRTLIDPADEWELSTIYNIARAQVGLNRDHQGAWPGCGEHKGGDPVLALLSAALKARTIPHDR
ncbi:hypothetical protein [Sphingopyxis sp. Geo48]|uniref:hypothetical protein n=1 Tax=Sphingopyxis sp. Geo48 TaxID=545241 RepID=UPI0024B6C788|nr:hypothetical protein [Sphingopyxis sp. Geo48]